MLLKIYDNQINQKYTKLIDLRCKNDNNFKLDYHDPTKLNSLDKKHI